MDTKRNSRLSGLISKLTSAANKSIKKESVNRKFLKSAEKLDYHVPMRIASIEQNLRTS